MKKINNYILFLIICLSMISCDKNHSYNKIQKRQYKEVICPKCEGTGTVPQTTSQKVGFAICTFGMTLMCDDEQQCPKCKGLGVIEIPVLNDTIIRK